MKDVTNNYVAEISVSYYPAVRNKPTIKTSYAAYEQLIKFIPPETMSLQECMQVMYLNRANRALGIYPLARGGINSTVVDVRLVLSVGLKTAASSFILCHNHPSGNLQPSDEDINITKKIKCAAGLFDMKVQDHIIISPDGFFSFLDEGIL